ncbi:MAG TPA: HIT domain-containing protein, partial [Xanthobacteraceae bacterium]|nr:HIT domain-containing protein [Xanthobacteraceae bacterium]
MLEAGWFLHPQLRNDAAQVGDLALSCVLSINDADYPWLILVPRRANVTEIADLGDDATLLMAEITRVSRVLKELTRCDKINVAAIGN